MIEHHCRAVAILEVVMVRVGDAQISRDGDVERRGERERIHGHANGLQLQGDDAQPRIPELEQRLTQDDNYHRQCKQQQHGYSTTNLTFPFLVNWQLLRLQFGFLSSRNHF